MAITTTAADERRRDNCAETPRNPLFRPFRKRAPRPQSPNQVFSGANGPVGHPACRFARSNKMPRRGIF
eukprot:1519494-Lingulodinium_polyedra.AAC.1